MLNFPSPSIYTEDESKIAFLAGLKAIETAYMAIISVYLFIFTPSLNAYIYPFETPIVKYLTPVNTTEFTSGFELVDCIYVINLEDRPEKWKRMQELLQQRNLNINRVNAINGWKLSDEVREELAGTYSRRMRNGHLGCFLSHVSTLKHAFDNGFSCIWIMEDDVDFKEDVSQISNLLKQLTEIDPEWDIFYTDVDSMTSNGNYNRPCEPKLRPDQPPISLSELNERTQITHNIMKLGQRYGMYSYLVSKKGVQKLLDYFTHVYIWSNIDVDIHRIPTIREYSTTKDIVGICFDNGISDTRNPINYAQPDSK